MGFQWNGPGDIPGPPGPAGPPGPPGGAGSYEKTSDVTPSGTALGEPFDTIQAAIDDVNSGLSEDQHALVRVFPGTYPEDINIPAFVHVVAMGVCKITGTVGNPTVPMATMAAATSLIGVRLENQDTKDIGLDLTSGGGTDLRIVSHVAITNLITGETLTEGIVVDTTAGVDVLTLHRVDVLLITAGACVRKETAAVELFTFACNFTIFGGGGDAIELNDGDWFSCADRIVGPIVITSPGDFHPSGTSYDPATVTGTGAPVTATTPAESVSFLGSGLVATDVKTALDEAYGTLHVVDPDNNDDLPSGFSVGHKWTNTALGKVFISVRDVSTEAIWQLITPTPIPISWLALGALAVGTSIDGPRVALADWEIVQVKVVRLADGSGGSTVVDINKSVSGGPITTLYTTQGNRPTVTAAAGDDLVITATLPDIVSISEGEFLTMDVDTVEAGGGSGAPQDMQVSIGVIPV